MCGQEPSSSRKKINGSSSTENKVALKDKNMSLSEYKQQLLNAKMERKRAESDAQMLSNRLMLLKVR